MVFWNRLVGVNAPVTIDFGDDTQPLTIDCELKHTYRSRGDYPVTLSSFDKAGNPVILKLEVKVE